MELMVQQQEEVNTQLIARRHLPVVGPKCTCMRVNKLERRLYNRLINQLLSNHCPCKAYLVKFAKLNSMELGCECGAVDNV